MTDKTNIIKQKWINRIIAGEELSIKFLYPYSKINLKKKKNLRKFNKNYTHYINFAVTEAYWSAIIFTGIYNINRKIFSLDLALVEPMEGEPKIELIYPNIIYDENN